MPYRPSIATDSHPTHTASFEAERIELMLKAISIGFRDGYDQPYEFNVGMTYRSTARQTAYDRASRVGQFIGRIRF